MSNQTHVEVSPSVRKSASERVREVDVYGVSPGCTECSCAKTHGGRLVSVRVYLGTALGPLGPLGFKCSQHSPTTRPSVERTAEKAFLLSDRVYIVQRHLLTLIDFIRK